MSTREKGTYQMLWDCPNCGTEKLLGLDHRHCPSCGSPQDPARRYYPAEGDKIAVEDHEYHGADRLCPACEGPNVAKAAFCGNCGCPMDDAVEAARRRALTAEQEDSVDAAAEEAKARREAKRAEARGEEAPKKGGGVAKAGLGLFGMVMVGVVLLGCCGLLGAFLFWKGEAAVTVTGHEWERQIAVERFEEVSKSDWKESVPSSARDVRCREEKQDTRKVADGETCTTERVDQGDGTFKEVEKCRTKYREEAVMGQKCSYTVEAWEEVRKAKAGGAGMSPPPSWPEVKLASGGLVGKLGKEREGDREERYTVRFKDADGEAHSCNFSEQAWRSYAEGSQWTGEVRMMGGGLVCDSLSKK